MINGSAPVILLTSSEIQTTVRRLASEVSRDYRDKDPVVVGILKGSFIFMADLVRLLDFPVEIDFVRLSSYGSRRETSGRVRVVQGLHAIIKGRHVLIVEDIVDTGLTTAFFLDYLHRRKPASVKMCVLMDKPACRRVPVQIDYRGLVVPDRFLVGYGTDCDEKYRNLPDIHTLEPGP